MNKKANAVADGAVTIVGLFVFAIICIVGFSIFTEMNTDIQSMDDMSNSSKELTDDLHTQYPGLFDGLFAFVLVALWISSVVLSFFIDSHPIFLVISVILITFVLLAGAYVSNTYAEITTDAAFVDAASSFPITNFIFDNLLIVILVMTTSVLISLYAKTR